MWIFFGKGYDEGAASETLPRTMWGSSSRERRKSGEQSGRLDLGRVTPASFPFSSFCGFTSKCLPSKWALVLGWNFVFVRVYVYTNSFACKRVAKVFGHTVDESSGCTALQQHLYDSVGR